MRGRPGETGPAFPFGAQDIQDISRQAVQPDAVPLTTAGHTLDFPSGYGISAGLVRPVICDRIVTQDTHAGVCGFRFANEADDRVAELNTAPLKDTDLFAGKGLEFCVSSSAMSGNRWRRSQRKPIHLAGWQRQARRFTAIQGGHYWYARD